MSKFKGLQSIAQAMEAKEDNNINLFVDDMLDNSADILKEISAKLDRLMRIAQIKLEIKRCEERLAELEREQMSIKLAYTKTPEIRRIVEKLATLRSLGAVDPALEEYIKELPARAYSLSAHAEEVRNVKEQLRILEEEMKSSKKEDIT